MVDKARDVAILGGVDDVIAVDTEEVAAADALLFVPLLPQVRHRLPNLPESQATTCVSSLYMHISLSLDTCFSIQMQLLYTLDHVENSPSV